MGIMQTASPTSPVRPTHRPRASHRAGSLQHAGSLHRARPTTRDPRRTTCSASNRSYRTSQRSSRFAMENLKWCFHRNQQYSVIALTNASGLITERYAYSAYGTPTILNVNLSPLATSAEGSRYTYTGREWDSHVSLYHYRARMYDSVAGRFCSKDPIGFAGSPWNVYQYVQSKPLIAIDPSGLKGPIVIRPHRTPNRGPVVRGPHPLPGTPLAPPEPWGPFPPGTGHTISPPPGTPEYQEWYKNLWENHYKRMSREHEERMRRKKEKELHEWRKLVFKHADEEHRRLYCPNVPPDTPIEDIEPEAFDECWSQYEQCLDTVMSTWDGRARNRCMTCLDACTAAGGTWSSRMNGIDCAHWNTHE
jgi:RHS repeat-associated protein